MYAIPSPPVPDVSDSQPGDRHPRVQRVRHGQINLLRFAEREEGGEMEGQKQG